MNIIEKHMVEMPDGVKLFTIVQRPPDTRRAPVIFQRGPYENKEIDEEPLRNADLRGYCIITQHCRGTALSEGDFIPYDDERRETESLAALHHLGDAVDVDDPRLTELQVGAVLVQCHQNSSPASRAAAATAATRPW